MENKLSWVLLVTGFLLMGVSLFFPICQSVFLVVQPSCLPGYFIFFFGGILVLASLREAVPKFYKAMFVGIKKR